MNDEAKCSREKYWSECLQPEKIERMRNQVKRLQREVAMLNKFMRYLQSHSHTPDGSVVIPLLTRDEPCLTEYHVPRGEKSEELYF